MMVLFFCACGEVDLSSQVDTSSLNTVDTETDSKSADTCKHTWGQWIETVKPTCESSGMQTRKCVNCSKKESKSLKKLSHKNSDWIIDIIATVGKEGSKHIECVNCKKQIETKKIPALGQNHIHKGQEWLTTKQPTCVDNGSKDFVCSCGYTMATDKIKAKGHTALTSKGSDATCTSKGLTDGSYCTTCNVVLLKQETIPAKGHSIKSEIKKDSSNSSSYILFYCSNCSYSYKQSLTDNPTTNPSHTHSYSNTVVSPTCNSEGYTLHKCSCGDYYKDKITPTNYQHKFSLTQDEWYGGYDKFICSKCGLKALSYGNADGSLVGGNTNVKYYVTCNEEKGKYGELTDFHIVIFGNGDMPKYPRDSSPMWHEYLYDTKKITIAHGVTSISTDSFVFPKGKNKIEFEMSDTVKVIEDRAINLNIYELVLGNGVERIEGKILLRDEWTHIYLPKSLKFIYPIDSYAYRNYYYEGSKEDFLKIKTVIYDIYRYEITIEELMSKRYPNGTFNNMFVFYNASGLYDDHDATGKKTVSS